MTATDSDAPKPQDANVGTLRAHLLQQMADNTIPVGGQVPPEIELMQQFGMSRAAVRKVLFELVVEGLIERRQGRGSFRTASGRMRRGSRGLVGVWLDEAYAPVFGELARGIYDELARGQFHCVIDTQLPEAGGAGRFDSLLQQRLDGLVFAPGALLEQTAHSLWGALQNGLPLVMIERALPDLETDRVCTHLDLAVEELVQHFVGLGHRRIGFVGTDVHVDMADAYQRWLAAGRFAAEPGWRRILTAEDEHPPPLEELGALLARPPETRPTALMCAENVLAMSVVKLARERGLHVPEDVSITGFEPLLERQPGDGWLTSYAQPRYRLGLQAARLLMRQIAEPTERPTSVLVQGHLHRGQSTGPAPAA